jgi:hypothetical protein
MIHRRRTHVALDRILGPARRRHTGNHRNHHRLVSAMVSARTSIPAHPCTSNVSAQHHRARRSTSHLDEAGLIRHRPRTRNGGSAGVGILLVASIESQLLGVISLARWPSSPAYRRRSCRRALARRSPAGRSRRHWPPWRLVSESRASRSRSGTELSPGPLAPYPF